MRAWALSWMRSSCGSYQSRACASSAGQAAQGPRSERKSATSDFQSAAQAAGGATPAKA
jgi:hypothetical protein